SAPSTADSAIVVTAGFNADKFVPTDAAIDLTLSRVPSPTEGTISVMVGSEDRTALFEQSGNHFVYRRGAVSLPSGASDVVVYLVSRDDWKELGRFPLKVLTSMGFTSSDVTPSLAANNSGQIADGR